MFSKTTEYALRATIYIAQKSTIEHKLRIDEIANAIDSPQSFTAKVLQILTNDNILVSSVRGPNGGFYMTDKAKNLPLYAVLEVLGDDKTLTKCILGLNQCSEVKPCPMHQEYKMIKSQLVNIFQNRSIKDLADDLKAGDSFIKNYKRR